MTTHKEQRLHRYSWQTYTWTLTRNRDTTDIPDRHIHDHTTRNRDNIDIPDRHIHDHTTRNRDNIDIPDRHIHDHLQGTDNIDIPDTHIHDHSQGTETTSIFLTHIYMTTHKEQRQHRYSWHIYTWPLTRNRDNIYIPDTYIHDHTTRNRDYIDIPDTYIHDHSQGTDNIDIPDTHIYDHSQGTETTSIFLTHIYMTTHKEQRLHRYSWHTYTWPLTRNRDNIDIPDTHIHDHSQGTETTSIFLTHIYMTTHKEHKEQRQHRYSWHTYTWPLTRNRDNIDIPDTYIHDHSQGTETTSIFLTDIYMTTHKEQRQHRYSWHIYTWPLTRYRDNIDIPDTHIHNHTTRNRENIDIPDTYIHDHSQGTEKTSIFLTDIYMTTHKEQRQHRYSWHTYT